MKKTILIFLLIIATVFQIFAETDDDIDNDEQTKIDERVDPKLTVPPKNSYSVEGAGDKYSDARPADMRDEIADLRRRIDYLQREIDNLKLRRNSSIRDDSFSGQPPQIINDNKPGEQPERGSGGGSTGKFKPALGIAIFVLAAMLIICIALLIYIKLRSTVRQKAALREKPARPVWEGQQDSKPYLHRQPGPSRTFGNAGTSSDFSVQRQTVPPATAPKPPTDEISPLYRSVERREKRHNSDPGDIFLDVKKSDLERLIQGEKIQPVLEKGGTRLSAQFVLVNNRNLYPNFHIYNETRELSNENGNDKVLSMIYELTGRDLPGFVEICRPAVVSPRGDVFTVEHKGVLKIY